MESFIFTRPFTFELKGEGEKEQLTLDIDISSNDLDLVNDIVSKSCLESMRDQIKSGNVKFDLEHEAFRGSSHEQKEINKTRVPVGRMENPTIVERVRDDGFKALALNVKGIINKFESRYKNTKGSIVNRFLDAASIAFIPTKVKTIKKDGEIIRILDDVKLLNVALTGNPVNTAAQMINIVAKSADALEEYKAAKKLNPDVENMLEVKASNEELKKETGSDKEKRKLRKEILNEGDEESEDEETKKYKKEKKAYEKDGAHAHTEAEPLGLHNHPEIENRIREEFEFVHERINELNKGSNPEQAEEIKTYIKIKEEKTMKKDIKNVEAEGQEEAKPTKVIEESKPEAESEPLSEIKAMLKGYEAKLEAMEKEIKTLKEIEEKDVEAPETKTNHKGLVENNDVKNISGKALAGLSELQ